MNGYQASGAAPIVDGAIVEEPRTVASAIRIGNPASWELALKVRDESKGFIDKVDDEEILDTYRRLASDEGVFCAPASAASLAGLLKRVNSGESFEGKTIVCVITGNGLKDPDIANEIKPVSLNEYPAKIESVEEALTLS